MLDNMYNKQMSVVSDDDNQAVIDKVTKDGTFDEIRRQVVEQLKKDEGLKKLVADMVENSQTLSSPDVTRLPKPMLLQALRKELEQELLEHASKSAWEVMGSKESPVTSFIDEKVHEALCAVYQERRQQAALATASYAQHAQHAQQAYYPGQQHPHQPPHRTGSGDPYRTNHAVPGTVPGAAHAASYYPQQHAVGVGQQRHAQHAQHAHQGYGGHYAHTQAAAAGGYSYAQAGAYPQYTQPHAQPSSVQHTPHAQHPSHYQHQPAGQPAQQPQQQHYHYHQQHYKQPPG